MICGGTPFDKLDNFVFGKWTLRKDAIRNHPAQIDAIAAEIISRSTGSKPVPTVCIVGHTDYIGRDDDNYELGLKRARSVKDALCNKLGANAKDMTFVVNSLGETDPSPTGTSATARAKNRRVEVFLLSERLNGETCNGGGGGGQYSDEDERCGVPKRSPRRELEFAQELQFEKTRAAKSTPVKPKLSLYLLDKKKLDRTHFHHQAEFTARRIGAIESSNASKCNPRVGPTGYGTGADIIRAMRTAFKCTKKPIETVHIFTHSAPTGLAGNKPGKTGIRLNSLPIDRAKGGRHISDIPIDVLSNDVFVLLHGCRQAEGCESDDNFAQSLYQHLSAKLSNPKVYAHYDKGCAGRHNSWCLYSNDSKKGKKGSAPPYVEPPKGCDKGKSSEVELEWQGEKTKCDTMEKFTIDNYGRGVAQLTSSQQTTLNDIKKKIRKRARNCGGVSMVEIQGHASTEGPPGRNKAWGQRRADVVKASLGNIFGKARVWTTSKGEEKPIITPDTTDAQQRRNRRVEIFVM